MKTLICDIQLGGSTKQFLTWNKNNLSRAEFVEALKGACVIGRKLNLQRSLDE